MNVFVGIYLIQSNSILLLKLNPQKESCQMFMLNPFIVGLTWKLRICTRYVQEGRFP